MDGIPRGLRGRTCAGFPLQLAFHSFVLQIKLGPFNATRLYAQKPSSGNAKDRGTPKCPPFIMDFVEVRVYSMKAASRMFIKGKMENDPGMRCVAYGRWRRASLFSSSLRSSFL